MYSACNLHTFHFLMNCFVPCVFFPMSFKASIASLQDRFLVMAAEMEQSSATGAQELAQFWKELPRNKIMEHR